MNRQLSRFFHAVAYLSWLGDEWLFQSAGTLETQIGQSQLSRQSHELMRYIFSIRMRRIDNCLGSALRKVLPSRFHTAASGHDVDFGTAMLRDFTAIFSCS